MDTKKDRTEPVPTKETALSTAGAARLGALATNDEFAAYVGDGFASVETVIFGDETENKLPRYVGLLIGEGAVIERTDTTTGEVRGQKTYAFHPMGRTADGAIGVVENVTHVIPASYMMQASLDRILSESRRLERRAVVGMIYRGQVKTRRGFRVNDIGIWEKYL